MISVEHLGKSYRLRHEATQERYTALRDVLSNRVKKLFRRAEANKNSATTEEFWALRDVSFQIRRGEVVGIIGRNGAGKSTLLKVLSRITEPTQGRVRIKGRVASLLEVGTGFHPELTGRENIYLNGAILGMTRAEIRRRFDEIVAFSEVDRFLDTPVKRYSSGMYVRLAFAVAAHLEPEILIVDEVLAVGDAEFQKKCLGKMGDVSKKDGRTVLFVSHNMAAVSSLTSRCILLNGGKVEFDGQTNKAIEQYVQRGGRGESKTTNHGRGLHTAILDAQLLDPAGNPTRFYTPGTPMRLEIKLETDGVANLSVEGFLVDGTRYKVGFFSLHQFYGSALPNQPGCYRAVLEFPPLWLASGHYAFDFTTSITNVTWDHYVEDLLNFEVAYTNLNGQSWDFKHSLGYGTLALTSQNEPRFEKVES